MDYREISKIIPKGTPAKDIYAYINDDRDYPDEQALIDYSLLSYMPNVQKGYDALAHPDFGTIYVPRIFTDLGGSNQDYAMLFLGETYRPPKQYRGLPMCCRLISPKEGDVNVDIGPAIGVQALYALTHCKVDKVIITEPRRQIYDALAMTFEPYKDRVELLNVACGESKGAIELIGSHFYSDPSIHKGMPDRDYVPCTTVDELAKDTHIDYLRIGTDGSEIPILKGAIATIKRDKPVVGIAVYQHVGDAEVVYDTLSSCFSGYNFLLYGNTVREGSTRPVYLWAWA